MDLLSAIDLGPELEGMAGTRIEDADGDHGTRWRLRTASRPRESARHGVHPARDDHGPPRCGRPRNMGRERAGPRTRTPRTGSRTGNDAGGGDLGRHRQATVSVVVIGGGQAGLATSHELTLNGVEARGARADPSRGDVARSLGQLLPRHTELGGPAPGRRLLRGGSRRIHAPRPDRDVPRAVRRIDRGPGARGGGRLVLGTTARGRVPPGDDGRRPQSHLRGGGDRRLPTALSPVGGSHAPG